MKQLILLFFFFIHSSVFASQNFVYLFEYLATVDQKQQCIVKINEIAQKISKQGGVTIQASFCREHELHSDFLSGVVRYLSAEQLKFTSSYDVEASRLDKRGVYMTLADCRDDFDRQLGLFVSVTSLQPFVAECIKRDSDDRRHGYIFRADALGASKVAGRTAGLSIYGKLASNFDSTVKRLKHGYEQYQYKVRLISFSESGFQQRLTVDYYGSQRTRPFPGLKLQYDSLNECIANQALVNASYDSQAVQPLVVLCEYNSAYYSLKVYVSDLLDEKIYFRKWRSSYANMNDCHSSILSEVREATDGLGENFFTGVCGLSGGKVVMYLLKSLP